MTDAPAAFERPQPELVTADGPWGPVYLYRGAEIRCDEGGQVCGLFMEGHPLHGRGFGAVGTVTPLVDLWVDIRGLPDHLRLALKPRGT